MRPHPTSAEQDPVVFSNVQKPTGPGASSLGANDIIELKWDFVKNRFHGTIAGQKVTIDPKDGLRNHTLFVRREDADPEEMSFLAHFRVDQFGRPSMRTWHPPIEAHFSLDIEDWKHPALQAVGFGVLSPEGVQRKRDERIELTQLAAKNSFVQEMVVQSRSRTGIVKKTLDASGSLVFEPPPSKEGLATRMSTLLGGGDKDVKPKSPKP